MSNLFISLLNMSIAAGWLILAVVVIRFLLKKAPRWISCVLWALVGIRLICPFSPESILSLIPSAETLPATSLYTDSPMIHSGIAILNSTVNPVISESLAPVPGVSVNPVQVIASVAAVVWVVGVVGMLIYGTISVWKIKRAVRVSLPLARFINRTTDGTGTVKVQIADEMLGGAVMEDSAAVTGRAVKADKTVLDRDERKEKSILIKYREKCRICDNIASPFILGIFRPMIYLPGSLTPEQMQQVLAHETAHLKRKDHWWKPLGFAILTLHWFNPLVWLAYVLLCRDIEMACDEKVVRTMKTEEKRSYSKTLLECSVSRRMISACPLAFGEVGVKTRIRSVLNYKKPAFWVVVAALLICVVVAVCFLTNPVKDGGKNSIQNGNSQSEDGERLLGVNRTREVASQRVYCFTESVDFMAPTIILSINSNRFQFTYSAFSSYIAYGSYRVEGEKDGKHQLILETSDGKNHYVFDALDGGYVFDEAASSKIPQYSYSSGAKPESPVPDGAFFRGQSYMGEFVTAKGETYYYEDGTFSPLLGPVYSGVRGDFDRDGVEERYYLGPAGTKEDPFTVCFHVYEDGERTHFNVFRPPYDNLRFDFRENGEIYLVCEGWKYTTDDGKWLHEPEFIEELHYEISTDGKDVVLETDGKPMEYWGEQGLESEWLIVPWVSP